MPISSLPAYSPDRHIRTVLVDRAHSSEHPFNLLDTFVVCHYLLRLVLKAGGPWTKHSTLGTHRT